MKILGIFVVLLVNQTLAQSPRIVAKSLLNTNPDSVYVSVYQVVTKEMISPEGQEVEKRLGTKKIAPEDVEILLKITARKSSYKGDGTALLTHYNILIDLYKYGSRFGSITISSLTGNITLTNHSIDEQLFDNVSQKLGDHIIQLLRKYDLLQHIENHSLEGLSK